MGATIKVYIYPQMTSKWYPLECEKTGHALDIFKRMSPEGKGIWKNIEGVYDPKKADYFVMRDRQSYRSPPEKTIRLGYEPPCAPYYKPIPKGYYAGLHYAKGDCYLADRWWVNYTYDELKAMKPPKKTKFLSCICSKKNKWKGHATRIRFLKHFCKTYQG